MTDITETESYEQKRKQAIKASRTMLLMQWPSYTVLGLIGIILPILGTVDETALIGTILLICGMTQLVILAKYGINPGFAWRFTVMLITFIACFLILTGALSDLFTTEQILGGYLAGTGGYIVIEGRYSFSSRHIESVVYCGYFAGVMGLMLFTGWPDLIWWTPAVALSLYLLALGHTARVFIYKEKSAQNTP
ncbi:hypothetical protein [Pseudemcibacter aquimaris]|uniref:hypothetical protein n=1 Tax=Pseudemcibacter aquimaris TaxID=2857064 RepID=UPI002010F73F|nr:hypothetical protein [Pseudemcibacter aquimaris]MCC3862149.1 hypothetical protein [Pseudemcibacter aquimaris]WDU58902.1 hypothetical protein KW060_01265 [Pseudemcibacter aquimaris]